MAAQKTNAKKKKRRRKQHRGLTVFFTVFIMLFMIGVVTGGMVALDIFTDVGILSFGPVDTSKDVAGVDYIDLDAYIANQSQTTIIYGNDVDGNEIELARLHGSENRIWCSLDEVCEDMKNAVVALEDKRFYMHDGVDWVRTIGVVVEYHFSQGGSTITQQLIKNLTGENSRTFKRKYSEIKNALALEKHFSKDTILEAYLNTIYLDMGCYGVKTAAEYYFDKTPAELTLMESAILASITNAPRKYDPIINYDNNRQRAVGCLDDMLEQGYITEAQYNDALAEKVKFVGVHHEEDEDYDEENVEITTESEVQSYYVDYIIEQVMDDLQTTYGYTESEAFRKVYYGGLKIYGALDMRIQNIMEDVYYSADEITQETLAEAEMNIKPDRTDLDLLFGCLLEWGLPLSLPYRSEEIEGCKVHTYNDGDLVACFDRNIPESVIRSIAKRRYDGRCALRAVFRDVSFSSSPEKINVEEIFKLLSPDTRVKVI